MELEIQFSECTVVLAQLPDELAAPSKPQTRSNGLIQRRKRFPDWERRLRRGRNQARVACRAVTEKFSTDQATDSRSQAHDPAPLGLILGRARLPRSG